jgi:hypothetical protein
MYSAQVPQQINKILAVKSKTLEAIVKNKAAPKSWWTPLWHGLVADKERKHCLKMGSAIWLFLYLLFYTDRRTGKVRRKIMTISEDTGLPVRTIKHYLARLRRGGYITTKTTGRAQIIEIQKWKLFIKPQNYDGKTTDLPKQSP